jgi:hypothetical protein
MPVSSTPIFIPAPAFATPPSAAQAAGLDGGDAGARAQRIEARSVQLDAEAVEHGVVLSQHLGGRVGRLQPLLEIVPRVRERRLIPAVRAVVEVDLAVLGAGDARPVGEGRIGEDHDRVAVGDPGGGR